MTSTRGGAPGSAGSSFPSRFGSLPSSALRSRPSIPGFRSGGSRTPGSLQRRAETDIAVANFRNELIYALAVRPMTYRGLEVGSGMTRPNRNDFDAVLAADYNSSEAVALDGRPYQMANQPDFIVQLQWTFRGLVNLNTITAPYSAAISVGL